MRHPRVQARWGRTTKHVSNEVDYDIQTLLILFFILHGKTLPLESSFVEQVIMHGLAFVWVVNK